MTAIVWTGAAGDGNFNNPANWSPQQVPGAADTVTISPAAATAITVSNDAVQSLTTSSKVTLNINNSTSLTIGDGVNTTFSNGGVLNLNSGGNGTYFLINAPQVTLTGGGTIQMDNNGNNIIEGDSASDVLINSNNTIAGGGQLGDNSLTFTNSAAGTVNANNATALIINTGANTVTNSGLLESTSTGGLVIDTTVNNGTAGKITATTGATVTLQNGASLQGGTLATSGTGVISVNGGKLDGTAHTVTLTAGSNLDLYNSTSMTLLGTITNKGSFNLLSGGNGTYITASGTVNLTGAGAIVMSDNGNNFIYGNNAADVLNNVNNTISGAGQIGGYQLSFNNEAAGVIDGNAVNNQLVINTTGYTMTNAGLIEATGAGGLAINSTVVNNGTTGVVEAIASTVSLNSSTLEGGKLETSGGGVIAANSAAFDGTSNAVTNTGTVDLNNTATLVLKGSIVNDSTINLLSAGNGTILLASGTVTLSGAGTVTMSNNNNNYFEGYTSADVIDNVNNTITGGGQLGNGETTIINGAAGVIDGSAANATLNVNTNGVALANSGLIEATGAAGLAINSTVVNDTTGGEVLANGTTLSLNSSTLDGGTLVSTNGGIISSSSGTLEALTSTATVNVYNTQTLYLLGSIVNNGSINIESAGNGTGIYIGPGGTSPGAVTLTGTGTLTLSDNGNNYIYGQIAGDELINQTNTIEGSGALGDGQLTFINDATVDATGSSAGLYLNTGGEAATNNGLMEATGPAGFIIQGTNVANANGTISANGGDVYLQQGRVTGGLIESTTGFATVVTGGQTGTLDGSTAAGAVTNKGAVAIYNTGTLNLLGSIVNDGSINEESVGNGTAIIVDSSKVTLTGSGTIVMSDNGNNEFYGATASDELDNVNNTISGAGALGANQLTIVNEASGVIDATGGNALYVQTGGSVLTNDGLMESTSTGGLVIQGTDIANATGTISAAGGNVYLQGGTITGGALKGSGGGNFIVQGGQTGTLDGSATAITLTAAIDIQNTGTLNLLGSIVNEGSINEQSSGNGTTLIIDSAVVTLTGSGTLVMSDNGNNYLYGATASDEINNVNNTIEGAGQLGSNQLTILNGTKGIIDATGANALLLQTGAGSLTNDGLIEATGTGGMAIINSDVLNASGTLTADGGGISLQGATVSGGLINGTGAMYVNGGQSGTLDGSSEGKVTNNGTVNVYNTGTLYLEGAIVNNGAINELSGGNGTSVILEGATTTVSGTGVLTLSDNSNNYFYAAATADVLVNQSTIEGAGQFGDGQMTLQNYGTIEATGGNSLNMSLGSTGINETTGKWIGIGSGGLNVSNGTYTNNGLIEAEDGSHVTFATNATVTNLSAGTLTGGTYESVANGHGAVINMNGTPVTTLAADVVLSGVGSLFEVDGTLLETTLTSVAKTGELQIQNGRVYTNAKALADAGAIMLAGGTLSGGKVTVASTGTLGGYGTVTSSVKDSGSITASGGTLLLEGTNSISGKIKGTTVAFAAKVTTLTTGVSLTATTIETTGGATLLLDTSVTYAGTFDVVGKSTISNGTGGAFTNTGTFEQTGTGVATISAPFTNSGAIVINAGGTLAFTGGLTNTGTITVNGVFTDTAALTGGTLNIGGSGAAATIASTAGSPGSTLSTLTMAGGTLNTNGTIVTIGVDYNNTAAGVGNAYTPFLGVTGTIDGQGAQLGILGVDGTTITMVNGVETISIAPGGVANFVIENLGTAGAADLRGALQTSVNGAHVTKNLTGSGVTAQNFGPIVAGGESSVFTIDYSSGSLPSDAINILTNFANTGSLVIDIVKG